MPVQYSGILAEVRAVRTAVGMFDVSHMGRLYISGSQSTDFLDWVLTGSASTLRVGRARYCLICNQAGGVIDDTIFYRLSQDRFLLIPNAGNREEVLAWFNRWIAEKFAGGCDIDDQTVESGLIAVQGPESAELLDSLCRMNGIESISALRPFAWGEGELQGMHFLAGRTGYTGEDGFELVVSAADAPTVWNTLFDVGVIPCGLGARDVLRLEASLPLHGHEIDQNTTPIEAGLERFVRTEGEYIGAGVLAQQREHGTEKKLVGLSMPGRSAPRAGYTLWVGDQEVGHVTSGSYSPTLDTSIAMGYVLVRYADVGREVDVDLRGRRLPARIVPMPFYSRPRQRSEPAEGRSQQS